MPEISKSLLVYTENHEPGGGNRYLTDFLCALPINIDVYLCSNKGAFFAQDLVRLGGRFPCHELAIHTEAGRLKQLASSQMNIPLLLLFKVCSKVPLIRTLLIKNRSRLNRKTFRSLIQGGQFSTAIAFNGGFPAALTCFDFLSETKKAGIFSVMSVVSMPIATSFRDSCYHWLINNIDGFIVNCLAIKLALVASRRIPSEKIQVLYNEAEIPTILPKILPRNPGVELRFGFIGRLEKSKGIFVLIEAFGKAFKSASGINLQLHGKVYDKALLMQAINEAECNSAVTINGPFDGKVSEILANIDVLILPSFWEGFPYVILEAMAAGVGVIASAVGGIPEIVIDGETGLLVNARDVDELSAAIIRVSQDSDLCQTIREGGLKKIQSQCAPESFKKNVASILANYEVIQ